MYNIRMAKLAVNMQENTEIEEALVENGPEDYIRVVNNEYLDKKEVAVSRGGNPVRTTTPAEEKVVLMYVLFVCTRKERNENKN